ncbi:MAG: glycosyltransferase family 2 protein [Candidatus Wallbacteria bacterium]|nr:glycosyltransferase family 2 protein [Candidatus Wallbacteria bacterium]
MLYVIPVYNEEAYLPAFFSEFQTVFSDQDRAIFVNDGSTDMSGRLLSNFAAGSTSIEILEHRTNLGLSSALKKGLARALNYAESQFPVVTLDADGQHNLKMLPQYMDRFKKKDLDVLIVSREFQLYPLWQKTGNRILSLIATILLGVKIRDIESGLRIMNRHALELILSNLVGIRYSIASEIVYICNLHGKKFENIGRNRINFYRSRPLISDFCINFGLGIFHLVKARLKHHFTSGGRIK